MNPIEELFRTRYVPLYDRLYGVAFGILSNSDDAADAVQEAMVKIWNMGVALADIRVPEAYAFKILRFTAIDMLRHRCVTDSDDIACCQVADGASEPSEPDTAEFLSKIVDSLPESQRNVILMSAFDNLDSCEIAEITGYTVANVRQLLSRGRKKIKEMYKIHLKS